MLKSAIEYVVKLGATKIFDIGDSKYASIDLHRVDEGVRAQPIRSTTLSGLVEYIKSGVDEMYDNMLIQVVSPTEVKMLSPLDMDAKRECLMEVRADIPDFAYGRYMDSESFIIGVRSKFVQNSGSEAIIRFAGAVESKTIAQYADDGLTQHATVKKGIAGKEDAIVPSPVALRPYRTFTEVEQPVSEFVFRMKEINNSINCAIFEADGGAWKHQAMKNIKAYLEWELGDVKKVTVIS